MMSEETERPTPALRYLPLDRKLMTRIIVGASAVGIFAFLSGAAIGVAWLGERIGTRQVTDAPASSSPEPAGTASADAGPSEASGDGTGPALAAVPESAAGALVSSSSGSTDGAAPARDGAPRIAEPDVAEEPASLPDSTVVAVRTSRPTSTQEPASTVTVAKVTAVPPRPIHEVRTPQALEPEAAASVSEMEAAETALEPEAAGMAPKPEAAETTPLAPENTEAAAIGRYSVQVGTFRIAENAVGLQRSLVEEGRPAQIIVWTDARRQVWRAVRIGHFDTREEAQRLAEVLRRDESLPAIVIGR